MQYDAWRLATETPDAREEAMQWRRPITRWPIPTRRFSSERAKQPAWLTLGLANRHGLVTGATGTGKTVSLQVMAEGFARAGVPVFAADIKGDLSGISEVGEAKDFILKRAGDMGLTFQPDQFSTVFWDVFGEQGHPVRATVTEMGPLLLSRMLDLNDVQEGVLNVAFRWRTSNGLAADRYEGSAGDPGCDRPGSRQEGLTPTTIRWHRSARPRRGLGNVTKATVGTIQRQLLVLENQGGAKFFGEPALALKDFMRTDSDGRGMVNILVADKLMQSPRLYATFLLWMLSELFEELPEAGDPPKPKLVFFFDEAHLLFNDAPKALMDKIEQVVRLIRSKGVGVYFVTQNPIDVPDKVLAQLGNRVQHALRAFTPRDQKAVAAAAQTFRPNPKLDTAKVIMELGKGEALVSFLEGNGTPAMVERVMIRPPSARIGPITPEERKAIMDNSPVKGKYDTTIDAESAYEMLQKRVAGTAAPADGSGRRRGNSRPDRRNRRDDFRHQRIARQDCRPVSSSREASRARSPTRWSAGWPPISANRSAARWAVRSAARSCAARSAGCCDDKTFDRLPRRDLPLIFRKVECAEISVAASAARYSVSGLLYRADGRRARSGNLGERKDQGLSALVLGRAAGPSGKGSLPQRSQRLFRIHLSAAARGPARDTQLFRQDTSLFMPVASERGRVVDDGAILERDDGIRAGHPARGCLRCRASSRYPLCSTCSISVSPISFCWR